jgi:hypothetical protein
MGKLKQNDTVFHIEIQEKNSNERLRHRCNFDKIVAVNGNKVTLEKNLNDDFDDDGKHGTNPKKKLVKINKELKDLILTKLTENLENISFINIDDSLLKAIERYNENEK